MIEKYPHHPIPDGAVLAPHHLYIGLAVAVIAAMAVWDDHPTEEPVVLISALIGALFGFLVTWPVWPVVGATGTLSMLGVSLVAVIGSPFWRVRHPNWIDGPKPTPRAMALLGVLVALDDAVEHAFGWPTPLDQLWKLAIAPLLPGGQIPA